jgi:hypothetical protein
MYIPSSVLNKPLGLIPSIIIGIVFLAVGGVLFYLVFQSVEAGEIWRIAKNGGGLVVRTEHPEKFWILVVVYSIFGAGNVALAVWSFVDSFRRLRR